MNENLLYKTRNEKKKKKKKKGKRKKGVDINIDNESNKQKNIFEQKVVSELAVCMVTKMSVSTYAGYG